MTEQINGDALDLDKIGDIIRSAKMLAKQYRRMTGRPLGITGEVAEYEAAKLFGLDLATVRRSGYDAVRRNGNHVDRLQIKGRCVLSSKPGQRIGKIDLKHDWDAVILVLMNADFEPFAMYEARRDEIAKALTKPGSKARNERGALSISRFKSIGNKLWPRE